MADEPIEEPEVQAALNDYEASSFPSLSLKLTREQALVALALDEHVTMNTELASILEPMRWELFLLRTQVAYLNAIWEIVDGDEDSLEGFENLLVCLIARGLPSSGCLQRQRWCTQKIIVKLHAFMCRQMPRAGELRAFAREGVMLGKLWTPFSGSADAPTMIANNQRPSDEVLRRKAMERATQAIERERREQNALLFAHQPKRDDDNRPIHHLLIVDGETQMLFGFVKVLVTRHEAFVDELHVAPAAQGKKLSYHLLAAVPRELQLAPNMLVRLQHAIDNEFATASYAGAGMRPWPEHDDADKPIWPTDGPWTDVDGPATGNQMRAACAQTVLQEAAHRAARVPLALTTRVLHFIDGEFVAPGIEVDWQAQVDNARQAEREQRGPREEAERIAEVHMATSLHDPLARNIIARSVHNVPVRHGMPKSQSADYAFLLAAWLGDDHAANLTRGFVPYVEMMQSLRASALRIAHMLLAMPPVLYDANFKIIRRFDVGRASDNTDTHVEQSKICKIHELPGGRSLKAEVKRVFGKHWKNWMPVVLMMNDPSIDWC